MLDRIWGWLLGAGAVVGAVLLALGKARQSGRDAERADQANAARQDRRKADEVERRVDSAGDADLSRLRDRWTRQ